MKNKIIRSMLSGVLCAGVLLSTCGTAFAAEGSKDETVFVKINESGKETAVVVSDQLRNVSQQYEIRDISDLTDILNVKGDELFEKNGNQLIWKNAGSNEIVYQGKTDKKLPVGISLTYELDGKQLTPEELKGKSGHLTIHVTYQNRSEGESYVPFLMLTAFITDGENFSNLTADHGRVISDGERQTVIGYGIPGMNAFLESEKGEVLNELEIPEGFTVEADVSDYSGITCMSVAVNDVFSVGEIDTQESMEKLLDSMNELTDAAQKLANGSAELANGTSQLKNGTAELTSGAKQLNDGSSDLEKGTGDLLNGTATLKDGAAVLADGTAKLSEGSKSLYAGADALSNGITEAKTGAETLKNGLDQEKEGITTLKEQASGGLAQLIAGVDGISGGINQVNAGAAQLTGGLTEAETGANTIAEGLTASKSGAEQLVQGIQNVQQGAAGLSGLANAIAGAIPDTVTEEVLVEAEVDNSDLRAAVAAALSANGVEQGIIDQAVASIGNKTVSQTATVTFHVKADTTAIGGYVQQLVGTATAVEAGAGALKEGASALSAGLSQLEEGAKTLAQSMGLLKDGAASVHAATAVEGALMQACSMVKEGLMNMGTALQDGTDQLISGFDQLCPGAGTLAEGLSALESGAGQLKSGAKDLNDGVTAADTGAKQLADGSGTLWNGAASLKAGASKLREGLGTLYAGTTKLADGANQVDAGAAELRDGMSQFNRDGIGKLNDLLSNDLSKLLDRVNLLRGNAAGYKSISGTPDGMDGSVKFIFVTK